MEIGTIITILSTLESLTKTSLRLYEHYKELKGIDPSSINLTEEEELNKTLQTIIDTRIKLRKQLINQAEQTQT